MFLTQVGNASPCISKRERTPQPINARRPLLIEREKRRVRQGRHYPCVSKQILRKSRLCFLIRR